MIYTPHEMLNAIQDLEYEDQDHKLIIQLEEDIKHIESGFAISFTATSNMLFDRIKEILPDNPNIPSLSKISNLEFEHKSLITRSKGIVVGTSARQLIPANLSSILKHANTTNTPVIVIIFGMESISNPESFKPKEHVLLDMPGRGFHIIYENEFEDNIELAQAIMQIVSLWSTEKRSKQITAYRASELMHHLKTQLDYLGKLSKNMTLFSDLVNEFQKRGSVLFQNVHSLAQSSLNEALGALANIDVNAIIEHSEDNDNLEARLNAIIEIMRNKIKSILDAGMQEAASDSNKAIVRTFKKLIDEISELGSDGKSEFDLKLNETDYPDLAYKYNYDFLMEKINSEVEGQINLPQYMNIFAKYSKSILDSTRSLPQKKIESLEQKKSDSDTNNDTYKDSKEKANEEIEDTDVLTKIGDLIGGLSDHIPEIVVTKLLPAVLEENLDLLRSSLQIICNEVGEKNQNDIDSMVHELYVPLQDSISKKRNEIQSRMRKLINLGDRIR